MAILEKMAQIVLPKAPSKKAQTHTANYDPSRKGEVMALPNFKEHIEDILSNRQIQTSKELIAQLVKSDPDASAALGSYLTTADVQPIILVKDIDGAIDRDGYKLVNQILEGLTTRRDYSTGFSQKRTLRAMAEDLRYMLLCRGGIAAEAIYDDQLSLSRLALPDIGSFKFQEKEPGVLIPWQTQSGTDKKVDIPTLHIQWYRKSPMDTYGNSPFIAGINTMAARQQVVNDLYRIMQVTGYPRMYAKVLEEVIANNAPPEVKADKNEFRRYLRARRNEISGMLQSMRADQPLVHYDSVEMGIINDKNPGMSVDIKQVIDTLNAQNQAGLKTMATVLGRGESGVNTGTVEAQLFGKMAGSINKPIGEVFSNILTQAIRFSGSESRVEVVYPEVDLRSELEMEAQKSMKASRLRQDLSDGIISDDEYHLSMYGRIRPDNAPELSGTGFNRAKMEVDAEKVTPNTDPVGRSVSKATDKSAKSNQNK
ncbi:hypothetical protein [Pseudoalteromonas sp.]|uniref:hypothetical protein n=1 Tax=Pseudoalteromonas sp. TaxID=53249 RepID=UPI00272C86E6|nr:hypothetical protein [Pseudoalteromonas sp.]